MKLTFANVDQVSPTLPTNEWYFMRLYIWYLLHYIKIMIMLKYKLLSLTQYFTNCWLLHGSDPIFCSRWVLLFELPGGVYGFMLPARFIRPVSRSGSDIGSSLSWSADKIILNWSKIFQVGDSIMSSVDAMARHIHSKR